MMVLRGTCVIVGVVILLITGLMGAARAGSDGPAAWILYQGNGGLRRMRPDGSAPQRITSEHTIYQVYWSANGAWIAYTTPNSNATHLFQLRPDGSRHRRLTDDPAVNLYNVLWSPDGVWLVYIACPDVYMTACRLYSARSGALEQHEFAASPGQDQDPAWSPDGAWLVFDAWDGANRHIYRARPDGSQMQQLVEGWQATWSPDGAWIVFNRNDGIYRMRPDGSGVQRLTTQAQLEGQAIWSPDGARIVFEARESSALAMHVNTLALYVMAADGSGLQRIAPGRAAQWSPDGAWIVFQSSGSSEQQLYRVRADGSDLQKLTDCPESCVNAQWSPDGAWIVFEYHYYATHGIYRMRPDGSEVQFLASGINPQWSLQAARDWHAGWSVLAGVALVMVGAVWRRG